MYTPVHDQTQLPQQASTQQPPPLQQPQLHSQPQQHSSRFDPLAQQSQHYSSLIEHALMPSGAAALEFLTPALPYLASVSSSEKSSLSGANSALSGSNNSDTIAATALQQQHASVVAHAAAQLMPLLLQQQQQQNQNLFMMQPQSQQHSPFQSNFTFSHPQSSQSASSYIATTHSASASHSSGSVSQQQQQHLLMNQFMTRQVSPEHQWNQQSQPLLQSHSQSQSQSQQSQSHPVHSSHEIHEAILQQQQMLLAQQQQQHELHQQQQAQQRQAQEMMHAQLLLSDAQRARVLQQQIALLSQQRQTAEFEAHMRLLAHKAAAQRVQQQRELESIQRLIAQSQQVPLVNTGGGGGVSQAVPLTLSSTTSQKPSDATTTPIVETPPILATLVDASNVLTTEAPLASVPHVAAVPQPASDVSAATAAPATPGGIAVALPSPVPLLRQSIEAPLLTASPATAALTGAAVPPPAPLLQRESSLGSVGLLASHALAALSSADCPTPSQLLARLEEHQKRRAAQFQERLVRQRALSAKGRTTSCCSTIGHSAPVLSRCTSGSTLTLLPAAPGLSQSKTQPLRSTAVAAAARRTHKSSAASVASAEANLLMSPQSSIASPLPRRKKGAATSHKHSAVATATTVVPPVPEAAASVTSQSNASVATIAAPLDLLFDAAKSVHQLSTLLERRLSLSDDETHAEKATTVSKSKAAAKPAVVAVPVIAPAAAVVETTPIVAPKIKCAEPESAPVLPTDPSLDPSNDPSLSVIECGILDPQTNNNTRRMMQYSSFFNCPVEVFIAKSDPKRRILYRASQLASHFSFATNKVSMFLSRKRVASVASLLRLHSSNRMKSEALNAPLSPAELATVDAATKVIQKEIEIYQSLGFEHKIGGRSGLKSGGFFVTQQCCELFESHFMFGGMSLAQRRDWEMKHHQQHPNYIVNNNSNNSTGVQSKPVDATAAVAASKGGESGAGVAATTNADASRVARDLLQIQAQSQSSVPVVAATTNSNHAPMSSVSLIHKPPVLQHCVSNESTQSNASDSTCGSNASTRASSNDSQNSQPNSASSAPVATAPVSARDVHSECESDDIFGSSSSGASAATATHDASSAKKSKPHAATVSAIKSEPNQNDAPDCDSSSSSESDDDSDRESLEFAHPPVAQAERSVKRKSVQTPFDASQRRKHERRAKKRRRQMTLATIQSTESPTHKSGETGGSGSASSSSLSETNLELTSDSASQTTSLANPGIKRMSSHDIVTMPSTQDSIPTPNDASQTTTTSAASLASAADAHAQQESIAAQIQVYQRNIQALLQTQRLANQRQQAQQRQFAQQQQHQQQSTSVQTSSTTTTMHD